MRQTLLRAITAATAITLTVMTLAPATATAAPTQATAQGLAKGRLLKTDGSPAAGAVVAIYAMPVETAQSHYEVGASGQLALLGQFRTDKQGRYAAAVNRAHLSPFRAPGGEVNLQLLARDTSGNVASIAFGLEPSDPVPANASAKMKMAATTTSPLLPVSVADLILTTADKTIAANSTPMPAHPATAKKTAASVSADPATEFGDPGKAESKAWTKSLTKSDAFVNGTGSTDIAAVPAVVCIWSLVADLGLKTVWLGGTYIRATGVSADVEYGTGASSSLGVGVSVSGTYGSYSQSGTVTNSSDGVINFPTNSGFQHVYTDFRYGKYGYGCDYAPGFQKYEVRSRYWAGGAVTYAPTTAPSAGYCVPQPSGSKFRKTTTTAYQFATGADTSGSIGIDLSSRTGFTSALTNYFVFNTGRRLCGVSDYPGGTPKRLVARV